MVQVRAGDMDMFVDHLFNFDNVSPFESWHLKLLNRVKEDIEEELERLVAVEEAKEAAKQKAAEDRQAAFKVGYKKKKSSGSS